jgi:hypothetical protein
MENRQQLAGMAHSHKIVHLFLRGDKLIDAVYVDHTWRLDRIP